MKYEDCWFKKDEKLVYVGGTIKKNVLNLVGKYINALFRRAIFIQKRALNKHCDCFLNFFSMSPERKRKLGFHLGGVGGTMLRSIELKERQKMHAEILKN